MAGWVAKGSGFSIHAGDRIGCIYHEDFFFGSRAWDEIISTANTLLVSGLGVLFLRVIS